jgi:hypothetical protein
LEFGYGFGNWIRTWKSDSDLKTGSGFGNWIRILEIGYGFVTQIPQNHPCEIETGNRFSEIIFIVACLEGAARLWGSLLRR